AIIVKADVQGSVEAIRQSLEKLSTDDVKVRVIHGAVGAITETDITLATASNAIVIGFNVRPDSNAIAASEREKVDVKTYRIIYDAIEDVKSAMVGMLEPEYKEVVLGKAEVRETYKISNVGTIAGCYVLDGKILRNSDIRVIRDGIVIFESSLASLKRFKDDVKEVAAGYECGLSVEKFNDIKEGDIIESFKIEAIKRKEL
ncbi:MAG: translation initiation factor IF-2, partial [Clostridium paraputrificum]